MFSEKNRVFFITEEKTRFLKKDLQNLWVLDALGILNYIYVYVYHTTKTINIKLKTKNTFQNSVSVESGQNTPIIQVDYKMIPPNTTYCNPKSKHQTTR